VDEEFMRQALALAVRAEEEGEVPVGAVIVRDGGLIASGWNQPISRHDPTAHAEICVLREAGRTISNYRLTNCTMYVTLEPCSMCAGAMLHARIARLVYGAPDARAGACGSILNLVQSPAFNHRLDVRGGVLEEECRLQLQSFFQRRRA
jgi:tRNA(adenine34) deaminase